MPTVERQGFIFTVRKFFNARLHERLSGKLFNFFLKNLPQAVNCRVMRQLCDPQLRQSDDRDDHWVNNIITLYRHSGRTWQQTG